MDRGHQGAKPSQLIDGSYIDTLADLDGTKISTTGSSCPRWSTTSRPTGAGRRPVRAKATVKGGVGTLRERPQGKSRQGERWPALEGPTGRPGIRAAVNVEGAFPIVDISTLRHRVSPGRSTYPNPINHFGRAIQDGWTAPTHGLGMQESAATPPSKGAWRMSETEVVLPTSGSRPQWRAVAAPSPVRSYAASAIGNALEWFDWGTYAVMSPFIAAALFSHADPTSALLSTLAVFAVGFVARPIGGFVFGVMADRRGRRSVLLTTMIMMAGSTFVIALIPTYATIGGWASVILVAARLVQGFAHGGESAISYSYVSEIAPKARRGLWGSGVFVSLLIGSIAANALAGTITSLSSAGFAAQWGWRIPFLAGAVVGLYALFLRRTMIESDVYEGHRSPRTADDTTATEWSKAKIVRRAVALAFFLAGGTVVHYTWTSYMGTYAITRQGMTPSSAYWAALVSQAIGAALLPLWGHLSDRIGRRPLIIGFGAILGALAFPMSNLVSSQWWSLALPATITLAFWGMSAAIFPVVLAENVTTRHRASVVGTVSSVAVGLFGGTAPYLNAQLGSMGIGWAFNAYVVALCVGTLIAGCLLSETKGLDLRDV
ncbi:MFS transporter [Streptomyces sp. NPDC059582]|uniref:MFS transporter n=1 Tax=Streptomyces sp. NPDC059582 TaxID=3346875 RepID=UPI0036CAA693